MRRVWTALVTFLAGICGCSPSGETGGSSTAVAVPTQDASIEAATDRARATIEDFKKAMASPTPQQTDFAVKVELRANGAVHFVWLQQVACADSTFTGTLGPDASGMKHHKPGDAVTVVAGEVADWMYVENRKLVGGFSLRAIRDKLRGPQRDAFEKSMWFEFD